MEEVWADIEGYENLYAISSKGRCWSYKTNKFLKEDINNDGYLRFSLFKNGKHKRYLAHRLVAKSFVANPNRYHEINHINETEMIAKNDVLAPVIYKKNNAQPASMPGISAAIIFFLALIIISRRAVMHIHTDIRNIAYTLGLADRPEYLMPTV